MADFDYNSGNESEPDSLIEEEEYTQSNPHNAKFMKNKKQLGGIADDDFDESDDEDDDNDEFDEDGNKKEKPTKKIEGDEDEDEDEEDNNDEEEEDEEDDIGSDIEEFDYTKATKAAANKKGNIPSFTELEQEDSDEEDDDEVDDDYLQKLDESVKQNIISEYHPELQTHNYDEIETLSTVVRNDVGLIIDRFHLTIPILTKYEKARVLGERAKQINAGAKPFIEVEQHIIDGYTIALKELEQKKIPFIISRPMPHGGCEYWRLRDLEVID
jgi:DNA-directed RNA polymerase I, II, and III subunit RPABC2